MSAAPGSAAAPGNGLAAQGDRVAFALRWLSALALLWTVAVRCLSTQVAQPVFDIDPMMAVGVQPGLAIGASLWLDALVIVAAAAGLIGEARSGRRVFLWLVVLAWLPMVAIVWHGAERVEHLWRGATWLSAMLGAVTLAHLGRDREIRRLALAMLVAVIAALVVRGVVQLVIEHPDTVRAFEATKAQFLAERGWAPGSPAARIYEERLRQPEASGWFGLANAFSTLMGAGALLAGGLALAGWRRRPRSSASALGETVSGGRIGWCAALALGCAGLLAINGSKGAFGALMIGLGVFIVAAAAIARGRALPRWLPFMLAALVIVAVAARGIVLSEGFANERSLLFRWHYLVDAARVIAAHPLVGVGPDGFQEAMIAVRSPRHPEEVASAHNVVADWWSGLGVLGLAWVVVAGSLLVRAVGVACGASASRRDGAAPASRLSLATRAVAVPLIAAAIVTFPNEVAALDPVLLILRTVGLLVAWATAVVVASMLETIEDDVLVRAGVFAALCAVVVHAQIELTMWLHGGAAWCLALLGVAAPLRECEADVLRDDTRSASPWFERAGGVSMRTATIVIAAMSVVGAGLVAAAAGAARRIERSMIAAAAPVSAVGQARLAAAQAPVGGVPAASRLDSLAAALRCAGVAEPTIASMARLLASPRPADHAIGIRTLEETLREREDRARIAAAAALRETASSRFAHNDARPALALADTVLRAGGTLDPAERLALLAQTREDLGQALVRIPDDLRLLRRRAETDEAVATISGQPEGWRQALASWQATALRDPCAIPPLRRVAAAAQRAGDNAAAAAALQRVLELDQELALDPRKQLDEKQREAIRREIEALEKR